MEERKRDGRLGRKRGGGDNYKGKLTSNRKLKRRICRNQIVSYKDRGIYKRSGQLKRRREGRVYRIRVAK